MKFSDSVSVLPGVGSAKEKLLNKMGIYTVGDLLCHFPRMYQNRKDVKTLREALDYGDNCAMVLTIGSEGILRRIPGGKTLLKFTAFDETGKVSVCYFNQDYMKGIVKLGAAYRFWGKVTRLKNGCTVTSPQIEPYGEYVLPDYSPVYPLTHGISQKYLIMLVGSALASLDKDSITDPIPEDVRNKYGILDIFSAYRAIHRPIDYNELDVARKRFIFQELYIFALSMTINKRLMKSGTKLPMAKTDIMPLVKRLPFELTDAQKRSVNEIYADMIRSPEPMTRLLSGDVGSGKTVCAEIAAYISLANGYQACIMAPTEILANQHYKDMKPLFEALGYKTELLTGSLKAAEKRKIHSELKSGDIRLCIGTHALLSSGAEFKELGLVITDEQHRFGVGQRSKLAESNPGVHMLVMTATPIPRSLALIMYGDLSLSIIDTLPPGRKGIDTYVINDRNRGNLYDFISRQVGLGRQVYIVCPSIEDTGDDETGEMIDISYNPMKNTLPKLKSAVKYTELLQNSVFPNLKVGLVHGKMKAKEKDSVMAEFISGNINILVSTTVIEVGINNPNASVMVIENAERFGLATLHQLRGRVGRGEYKSYCVLVSDTREDSKAFERLNVLKNSQNGYEIAEYDLKIRGPGDILAGGDGSIRQSGEAGIGFIEMCDDIETLKKAYDSAEETLKHDPELSHPENLTAKQAVERLYKTRQNTVN